MVTTAQIAAPIVVTEGQKAAAFLDKFVSIKAADFRKYTLSTDGNDIVLRSWCGRNPALTTAKLKDLVLKNADLLQQESSAAFLAKKNPIRHQFVAICDARKEANLASTVLEFAVKYTAIYKKCEEKAAAPAQKATPAPAPVEKPAAKAAAAAEAPKAAPVVAVAAAESTPAEPPARRTSPRLAKLKAATPAAV